MPRPIVFDFTKKTVTHAGDPAVEKAVRDALASQKGVVMTGPGIAKPTTQR